MTAIDKAMQAAVEDGQKAKEFYELFFDTEFLVPTHDTDVQPGENRQVDLSQDPAEIMAFERDEGLVVPIFDTEARLAAWAEERDRVPFLRLYGRQLVQDLDPELTFVLNPGTEHAKLFVREELDMLRSQMGAAPPPA